MNHILLLKEQSYLMKLEALREIFLKQFDVDVVNTNMSKKKLHVYLRAAFCYIVRDRLISDNHYYVNNLLAGFLKITQKNSRTLSSKYDTDYRFKNNDINYFVERLINNDIAISSDSFVNHISQLSFYKESFSNQKSRQKHQNLVFMEYLNKIFIEVFKIDITKNMSRKINIVEIRGAFCYIVRNKLNEKIGFLQISNFIGKHHASVIYLIEGYKNVFSIYNKNLKQKVDYILSEKLFLDNNFEQSTIIPSIYIEKK